MDETGQRILSAFDQLGRTSLNGEALCEFLGGDSAQLRAGIFDALPELVNAGLLRDDGAGFYSRTEDGRMAVVGARTITVYTRTGCHLCEEAKSAIAPLAAEFSANVCEIDIDSDPALHSRYTNDVPVIFVGHRFLAKYRVDAASLRRALQST